MWYILGMAKLDRTQIEHVAKLAKLPISSNELSTFQGQLSEITEYVSKISNFQFPISNREATSSAYEIPISNFQTGREDKMDTKRCLTQEEATGNAKNKHNGLFMVDAIFKE